MRVMRYLRGYVLCTVGLLGYGLTSYVYAQDAVWDVQGSLEEMMAIKRMNITHNVPYDLVSATLDQYCSDNSRITADSMIDTFTTSDTYKGLQNASAALYRVRFNFIKGMLPGVTTGDAAYYCSQKYFIFGVLQDIQQNYLAHYGTKSMTSSGTIATGLSLVQENTGLVGSELNFATLAEYYIRQTITDLMSYKLLSENDLKQLDGKIILKYVYQCGTMHGSYHMTQQKGGGNRQFGKIQLMINICDDSRYVTNYRVYVNQLFVHELGHYLYYFKDNRTQKFDEICWSDGVMICGDEEFVSSYAQKNKEEDYAESFAYWYLTREAERQRGPLDHHPAARPQRIVRRGEYFDELLDILGSDSD